MLKLSFGRCLLPEIILGWVCVFLLVVGDVSAQSTVLPKTEPTNLIGQATADHAPSGITLSIGDRKVAVYQDQLVRNPDTSSPWYDRSGFLHPVMTPTGRVVTAAFPTDHPHQHAIMFAWTSSIIGDREVDFWNSHRREGHIEHAELLKHSDESIECVLHHIDDSVDPPLVAIKEHWRLKSIPHDRCNVIDFESTQAKLTDEKFIVRKYHYGGMCVRGSEQWTDPVSMITSESRSTKDGNHTQPRWVAMYGPVDGQVCGIAAISHPSNFRHPQHVRLHPKMPYFCFYPAVDSGFEIRASEPYRSRFRIVTFDGPPDVELLDELADSY
ncbi:DUF6807 domain-containing protein [Neorhodopirellula pilleata]|uniref:CRIB domain-containing protein n=1 Tax=Neorhodopirellula pilleata TaxID=2714738 RepID=A0A5C6ACG5_9BACT|nr:PmoA family protein [Neorhodopirellula pilleata]TWT97289.1 hypothetical protein Pla100_24400 [Neorhodopirellula pilleata]